jgi:hypothetical protein
LPLGSFSGYLDPKLLITLSFLPSASLAAGEFTVYKRARRPHYPADSAKNLILFSYLESQRRAFEFTVIVALLSTTIIRLVSSNIPSLIVTSHCCSIPSGATATGSASGSAKTRGRPARARHFIWCAHQRLSPFRQPRRVATTLRGSGHSARRAGEQCEDPVRGLERGTVPQSSRKASPISPMATRLIPADPWKCSIVR